MNMIKKSIQRFQKQCETSDNHKDYQLQTHYYKTSEQQVFSEIQRLLRNQQDTTIISASEDRGEISALVNTSKQILLIISIIPVHPFNIAVDFTISTEKTSITGMYPALKAVAVDLYKELDLIFPTSTKMVTEK
jgi:hypothetical protein